jgi:hypothetical protein
VQVYERPDLVRRVGWHVRLERGEFLLGARERSIEPEKLGRDRSFRDFVMRDFEAGAGDEMRVADRDAGRYAAPCRTKFICGRNRAQSSRYSPSPNLSWIS